MIKKAVIPVAGLGTRFLPVTKSSPKEMLPLVDKPLIQYIVEEAVDSGIEDVIFITGRGKRSIEDYFDISFELEENLKAKGKLDLCNHIRLISEMANFCYVRQMKALGLGHAVLCGKPQVGNEPFAVLLGDDIIESEKPFLKEMIDLYETVKSPIIGLQEVSYDEVHHYGIVDGKIMEDGTVRIDSLVEKPDRRNAPSNLAVIGRYVLTPDIFEILENLEPGKGGEIQLTDGLNKLASKRPMCGCLVTGVRHDAGDKLGFLKANVEYGLKHKELGEQFKKYLLDITSRLGS